MLMLVPYSAMSDETVDWMVRVPTVRIGPDPKTLFGRRDIWHQPALPVPVPCSGTVDVITLPPFDC